MLVSASATPPGGRRIRLIPVAVGFFAAGLLAVLVVLGLYAFGQTELPWWLSVTAVGLTSIGFALGLVALLREARAR